MWLGRNPVFRPGVARKSPAGDTPRWGQHMAVRLAIVLLLPADGYHSSRRNYDREQPSDPQLFRMYRVQDGLGATALPFAYELRQNIPLTQDSREAAELHRRFRSLRGSEQCRSRDRHYRADHGGRSGANPHLSGAGGLFKLIAKRGGAKSESLCGSSGEQWP